MSTPATLPCAASTTIGSAVLCPSARGGVDVTIGDGTDCRHPRYETDPTTARRRRSTTRTNILVRDRNGTTRMIPCRRDLPGVCHGKSPGCEVLRQLWRRTPARVHELRDRT